MPHVTEAQAESGGAPPPSAERLIARLRKAVRLGEAAAIAEQVQDDLAELIADRGLTLDPRLCEPCAERYARRLLHREPDGSFTVVVMTWGPGQGTPLHDHAGIWCVEGVVRGRMEVRQLELVEEDDDGTCRFEERGRSISGVGSSGALIPPFEYHTLANALGDRPSITLHVYGGEMSRCSVFEDLGDGTFRRRTSSLSYTE